MAAASSVYTTILTAAVPAFNDTIIYVYPCVRAYIYGKCVFVYLFAMPCISATKATLPTMILASQQSPTIL